MTACVLILVALCSHVPSKQQIALNAFSVAATFTDTERTQINLHCGCGIREMNPLARPFENHGYAIAYVSASAETFGTAWLADRLKNSHNRIVRKLWWLPQVAVAGGHIAAMAVSH